MTKKSTKKASMPWIIVPLLVLVCAVAAYSTFINYAPHFFSTNECLECHFTIPQAGGEKPLRFVKPVTELCGRCHKDLNPLSHVVDVVPTMNMPEGMPLDALGMLTCATCHDPHRNRVDTRTGKRTYYLRTDRQGKAFCLLCHEDPQHPGEVSIFSKRDEVTHRRSMTRSHGFSNFSVVDKDVKLDRISLQCMGCHGADEKTVDLKKLGQGVYWMRGSGIGLSHPVGVDYDDAAWKNRELIPLKEVDKRIKFFDGKVGCCSCHDPYSPGGGAGLVIGAKDSYQALCLACHNV
jgi:predicted CXXCH cytochrome family protein